MASYDAQGAMCSFFPAPLPPGGLYRALQPRAQTAELQELCRRSWQLSAFTPKHRLVPLGKHAIQETHSLLFTCMKASKSLASTSKQQTRAHILKSSQLPTCWVSSSWDVPPRQIFPYNTQWWSSPYSAQSSGFGQLCREQPGLGTG